VRSVGAPMPLQRLLVPITGAAFSRLGATVALLYAQAVSAQLTALYVKEMPAGSWRNLRYRVNRSDEGPRITGDIKTMAEEFGLSMMTEIASGSRPENAIIAAAERGQFDLLVMGVQLRPAEQALYFGPKVEHILRNVGCAVAVVVMPEIPAAARV
jgi:nucleotide-binding universal stress UspA family protein